MRKNVFSRLLAMLLLIAILVGICPAMAFAADVASLETKEATRAAATGPAKDVGTYYLVESIPEIEGCYAQQGMGLLGDYIYSAQISSGDAKAVIYRTSRLTGETIPMTIDGATYSSKLGHANDICGAVVGNDSYLFVTVLKDSTGDLNKVVCLKITDTALTTVATYTTYTEGGSALNFSGLSTYKVDGNNVTLLVTHARYNYLATFDVTAGDASVTCEFAFQLDNTNFTETALAAAGFECDSLTVQGSCYADGTFYMPLGMGHKNVPVDNHGDAVQVILVYPNIDEAIASKNNAVTTTVENAIRVPHPDTIWSDIESVAVEDGILYFNTTRILLDESTVTSISFITDEYSKVIERRQAFAYDSVYLLTAPSNSAYIMVDVGAEDGHLEIQNVTPSKSAWFGFENNGQGYYYIKNIETQKYLTVNDDGSVTQSATKTGSLNQLWSITQTDWPTSNTNVAILSLYDTGTKNYLNQESMIVTTNSTGKTFVLQEALNKTNLENYLFDLELYNACYPDSVGMTRAEGIAHYKSTGLAEGRVASVFFDPIYYLENHPDLGLTTYQEAYDHFVNYGFWEGRQGSLFFSCNEYINHEGGLVSTGIYPEKSTFLWHFYTKYNATDGIPNAGYYGSDEFKIQDVLKEYGLTATDGYDFLVDYISRNVALSSVTTQEELEELLFDADYYALKNPGLNATNSALMNMGGSTLEENLEIHWNKYGKSEGRIASPYFTASYYRSRYSDYGTTSLEAYNHFVQTGFWEGRAGSVYCSDRQYLYGLRPDMDSLCAHVQTVTATTPKATCSSNGLATTYCCDCSAVLKTTKLAALEHTDDNSDNTCDVCAIDFGGTMQLRSRVKTLVDPVPTNAYYDLTGATFNNNSYDGTYYMVSLSDDGVYRIFDPVNQSNIGTFPATTVTEKDGVIYGAEPAMAVRLEFLRSSSETQGIYVIHINEDSHDGCYLSYGNNDAASSMTVGEVRRTTATDHEFNLRLVSETYTDRFRVARGMGSTGATRWLKMQNINGTYCYRFDTDTSGDGDNTFFLYKLLTDRLHTENLYATLKGTLDYIDPNTAYDSDTYSKFLAALKECVTLYEKYNGTVLSGSALTNRQALQDTLDGKERELINLLSILKINMEGKTIRHFPANMYNYNEDNMNALVDVLPGADTAGFYFESGLNKTTTAFYSNYDGETDEIVKNRTIRSQMYSISSGIAASDLDDSTNKPFAPSVVTADFWSETPIENAKEVYVDVGVPFTYKDGYYTLNSDTNAVFFEGEPTSGVDLAISELPAAYYWSGGMAHGTANPNYVVNDHTTFKPADGYVTGFQPFAKMTTRKAVAYTAEASVFEATNPVESYLLDGVAYRSAVEPKVEVSGSGTPVWGFGMKLQVPFFMTEDGCLDDDNKTPITFEFSGDDDVWVYIDDKLVLDIGGSHDAIQGVINFTDGSVIVRSDKYDRVRDKNTNGYGWSDTDKYDPSDLSEVHSITTNKMYQKNIYTEVFQQTIEEFADNDGESHTLTIYYMDRGKGRTNSMIKFNLPQTDILTVNKDVKCATYQGGKLVEMDASESASLMSAVGNMDFEYTLTDNGTAVANQAYHLLQNGVVIDEKTTNASGKFTLKHGQSAEFYGLNFTADNKYNVVETVPTNTWFNVAWSYSTTGSKPVTASTPAPVKNAYNDNISSTVSIDGDFYANETITFNCTNTFVDFADVMDEVIVDYGKTMLIDVMENDPPLMLLWGYNRSVQGFADYTEDMNLITSRKTAGKTTYSLGSGELSIVDGKVQFAPKKMLDTVERVYCVVQYSKGTDLFYVYEELRIIPATVMYYETDFTDGVFETERKQNFLFVDFGPDEPTEWQNAKGIAVTQDSEKGIIHGDIESDTTPFMPMYNPTLLNYTLREGDVVSIRIKVNVESATSYSGIQIYMATTTTGHTNYKEETSIRMTDESRHFNTDNFVTLQYPVNELLVGETLRAFRVDPFDAASNVKGTVDLDYIYIGPAANAPADDYLFFDFDNGTDDQLRYKQEQYGGFNYDEANWASGGSNGYSIDNTNGTLTVNVSSNTSYDGPYLSVTNTTGTYPWASGKAYAPLNYRTSGNETMHVRLKITDCNVAGGNNATAYVVSHSTRGGSYRYTGGEQIVKNFEIVNGEYITLSIPMSHYFQEGDIIKTIGLWFVGLTTSGGGKIEIDYIYVGKEEDFNKVAIYNRSEWKTVTDQTTSDDIQDSGLSNNDSYLLIDFNEDDKTIWDYRNAGANTVTKDVVNGVLKGKITNTDPWAGMIKGGNQVSYTFKKGDVVQVRIKTTITKPTTKQVGFQFYYTTREDPNYDATKRVYDNYYDHITGEYEIVTLEVPEAHFGQTIADLRVDPVVSALGDGADGSYEIDYIYVGPKNRAPGNDVLFFDFNNDDLSEARYRQDVYGGFNGDTQAWTHGSANTALMNGSENGTAECTAVYGKIVHCVQASTNLGSGFSLSYKPKSGDVAQIRVKFENFKASGTPFAVLVGYYGATSNSNGDTKDDGVEVVARSYIDASYLNAGEYVTLTFPINSNYTAMSNLSTFRLHFNDLTSISESQLGKITIDYIYIGSEDTLPTNGRMVLGYDSSYNNDIRLSNGSSLYIEGVGVPRINTDYTLMPYTGSEAAFTFTGTGFDLISRTGTQQGALRVMIWKADGTYVKTISVLNKSEKDLELYQIPIVSVNDLKHGTYQVRIFTNAAYDYGNDGPADDYDGKLDRGNEFYFDAVRIYNPIDTSTATVTSNEAGKLAYEAYLNTGEADPTLTEVRKILIDANNFNAGGTMEGVLYLDNTDHAVSLANYASYGPNNETYLSSNMAIAFKLSVTGTIPASIDIGAKSANAAPANLTLSFSNTAPTTKPEKQDRPIASTTVQYYPFEIPAALWKTDTDGSKFVYVVVSNVGGSGVLSITDVKYAYDSSVKHSSTTRSVRFLVDAAMVDALMGKTQEDAIVDEDLSFEMNISAGADMKVAYTIKASDVSQYTNFYLVVNKSVYGATPVETTYSNDANPFIITNVAETGEPYMYRAFFEGINAKEMNDTFEATLYAVKEDGTYYCSKTVSTSIKEYLLSKLEEESAIAELKTMCVDMLNYGATAQLHFAYDTENLVNADLTDAQKAYATSELPTAVNSSATEGEGVALRTSVSVKEKVYLNLTATYTPTDASALKAVICDAKGNVIAELPVTVKNNVLCQASYGEVGAKQMRQLLTATLYEGDKAISTTITWSVESYVATVRANGNAAATQINMVNAMLTYGDAVAAYMIASGQDK